MINSMAIKKGDFIELDYTGKLADTGDVFDTTVEAVAKKEHIHGKDSSYGSIIVALGEGQLLPGLDRDLVGKEVGKHNITVADVDGFGKKSAKLLRLVPAKVFAKENIRPYVGLQVNVDNQMGTVRSASGGRIIVDFNHPLSSKDLVYDVDVKRIVTDKKEQVESFFKMIGIPVQKIEADQKNATVFTHAMLPTELTTPLVEDIKRLTGLNTISFESGKKPEVKPVAKKAEVKAEGSSADTSTPKTE